MRCFFNASRRENETNLNLGVDLYLRDLGCRASRSEPGFVQGLTSSPTRTPLFCLRGHSGSYRTTEIWNLTQGEDWDRAPLEIPKLATLKVSILGARQWLGSTEPFLAVEPPTQMSPLGVRCHPSLEKWRRLGPLLSPFVPEMSPLVILDVTLWRQKCHPWKCTCQASEKMASLQARQTSAR